MRSLFYPFSVSVLLVVVLFVLIRYINGSNSEWYLACVNNQSGQEYMLKVPHKPALREGIIWFDNNTFMAIPADSTCRRIPTKDVQLKTTNKTV